jgi:hypothetical protein
MNPGTARSNRPKGENRTARDFSRVWTFEGCSNVQLHVPEGHVRVARRFIAASSNFGICAPRDLALFTANRSPPPLR